MIYYIVLYLLMSLGVITCFLNINCGIRRLYAIFIIILLILFSGLRWKTGTDWEPYFNLFSLSGSIEDYLAVGHYESGFKFLNWIFNKLLDNNYTLWLLLLSVFIFGSKYIYLSRKKYFLIFLFVLISSFLPVLFPTRQILALAIVFIATYKYSSNKNLVNYVLLIVCAASIHKTAIVAFFIPLIISLSMKFIFLLCVFVVFFNKFIVFLLGLLDAKFKMLELGHQIDVYSLADGSNATIFGSVIKIIILLFCIYIFFDISKKENIKKYKFEIDSLKIYIVGTIGYISISFFNFYYTRFYLYFLYFEPIVISFLFYFLIKDLIKSNKYSSSFLFIVLLVCFCLFKFFNQINVYLDLYIPYESIFNSNFKNVY